MAANPNKAGSESEPLIGESKSQSKEDSQNSNGIEKIDSTNTTLQNEKIKEKLKQFVKLYEERKKSKNKTYNDDTDVIYLLQECAYDCKLDLNQTDESIRGGEPMQNKCKVHWDNFEMLKDKIVEEEKKLIAISFAAMCADKRRGYLDALLPKKCENEVFELYQAIKTKNDTEFSERLERLERLENLENLENLKNLKNLQNIKEKVPIFMYLDDEKKYTLLQAVAKHGMVKSYKSLVKNFEANPLFTPLENHHPIQLSCLHAQPQMLEYLISEKQDRKHNMKTKNDRTLLHLAVKNSTDFVNSHRCLKILLEQEEKFGGVNDADKRKRTPLHYALMNENEECAIELLKNGAHLDVKDCCNQTPLMSMSKSTFKKYLNSMIKETKGERQTEKRSLVFDFTQLFRNSKRPTDEETLNRGNNQRSNSEAGEHYGFPTYLLSKINEVEDLKESLSHPILSIIIYFKWRQIRPYFWCHLFIYSFFCIYYTWYVVSSSDNPVERISAKSRFLSALGYDRKSRPLLASISLFDMVANMRLPFIIPISAIILLFLILELLKIIQSKYATNKENNFCITWKCIYRYFFNDIDNIVRLVVIILAIIVMICQNYCFTPYCSQIKAISILLTWIEFFLVLGKYPHLSFYVTIFRSAFWHLLKFLALHFSLIIGFALSFHTLFRSTSPDNIFIKPFLAIFKTLVMLTSEFDASDIPFDDHAILSRLIFIAYIFIATFVLFNLMIGIAFKEVNEIEQNPFLYECIAQISIIKHYEDIFIQNIIFEKVENFFCQLCQKKIESEDEDVENNKDKNVQEKDFKIVWDGSTKNFKHHFVFGSKPQGKIIKSPCGNNNYSNKLHFNKISDEVIAQARKIVSKTLAKTDSVKKYDLCKKLEAVGSKLSELENSINCLRLKEKN